MLFLDLHSRVVNNDKPWSICIYLDQRLWVCRASVEDWGSRTCPDPVRSRMLQLCTWRSMSGFQWSLLSTINVLDFSAPDILRETTKKHECNLLQYSKTIILLYYVKFQVSNSDSQPMIMWVTNSLTKHSGLDRVIWKGLTQINIFSWFHKVDRQNGSFAKNKSPLVDIMKQSRDINVVKSFLPHITLLVNMRSKIHKNGQLP